MSEHQHEHGKPANEQQHQSASHADELVTTDNALDGVMVETGAGTIERQAALLSKTNEVYHGGVARRTELAHHLQRQRGNRYTQRVVAEAQRTYGSVPASRESEDANFGGAAIARLPNRGPAIQRDLTGTHPTALGEFRLDMKTRNNAATGAGPSGLDGTIEFEPKTGTPFTNKLGFIQVVKVVDDKGADFPVGTMPAATRPFLETKEDKAKGIEGQFFTDVLHQEKAGVNVKGPGDAVLPYYPFAPAGRKDIFGFKRSDDKADIQSAKLFDFPGIASKTAKLNFDFETVAKGDDNMVVYGAVKWGFQLRGGSVVNEQPPVINDAASATWTEALKKHRDFYVHEPVTFYFGFDQDQPEAGEADKIDEFIQYLADFPDVRLDVEGFADLRGSATYNLALAQRRAESIAQALLGKGIDAGRINPPRSRGATKEFAGALKESNFRSNRRVTLTFIHTASVAPK